jgi:hypothetical protein
MEFMVTPKSEPMYDPDGPAADFFADVKGWLDATVTLT